MRLLDHALYIPQERCSIREAMLQNGQSLYEAKAFSRLFGFEKVARLINRDLNRAFAEVLDRLHPDDGKGPDSVIYCHGNPVQYDGDCSPVDELLQTHPVLADVTQSFEVDQHTCASLFWALELARGLLREGSRRVLVLAGDSVEGMPLTERHAHGVTAVGDAFAGLLLDDADTGIQIGDIYLDMRAEFHHGRTASAEQVTLFNAHHTELVQQILDNIGLRISRPTAIVPHNVNRLSWQKFCKDTGVDMNDIWLDLLPDTGHCYTVDTLAHLERFFDSDRQDAAMISVGQGGFLGGVVLSKEAELCRL